MTNIRSPHKCYEDLRWRAQEKRLARGVSQIGSSIHAFRTASCPRAGRKNKSRMHLRERNDYRRNRQKWYSVCRELIAE